MNTRVMNRVTFAITVLLVSLVSACGTLEIESEPAAPRTEPIATATEIAEPTAALEEMVATTSEPTTITVEAEAADEPLATVGYSSEETGISFNYPTGWSMEEKANAFVFRNESVVLRVGYRMPGDLADLFGRTGMGGTGISALEGTAQFLGQELARYGVFYDDLLTAVLYGGPPGTKVQSGAMEFTIVLDDPDTDYQTLTITDEFVTEAEMILASLSVGSTQGGPFGDLLSHTNPEYGFTFHYPSTWTVEEVNDEDFVGPDSRSVQLSQGTVKLVIGYRRSGENVAIGGSGAPGGGFDIRGTTPVVGQDVDRYVIVFEGKDKVVMYGEPGLPPISAGGLEFAIRMDDFAQVAYEEIELSETIQDEADMILSSLAIIEVEGSTAESKESEPADETAEATPADWKEYSNEAVGYWLLVPAEAEVVGLDPSQRVFFIGPEVNGRPQFQFGVDHYDSSLPDGTDFFQQVIEDYLSYLETVGRSDEGEVEELLIAGEPAIRLRHPGTIEADQPRDDFFFVHGDKIFQISITLFDGVEDEILNNRFLQSITFMW